MVSKTGKRAAAAASAGGGGDGSLHHEKRFKGVRMRSWGKWVSEIRLPNTRARLWLGSFATARQAARAFDVAVVCLRGSSATLNFPDSPPAHAPLGLPHHQIQLLAAAAAAAEADDAPLASQSASFDRRTLSLSTSEIPSEPASPSCTTQSEPAFSTHPKQPLATHSESVVSTHSSAPASLACSSPFYSCCDELEAATSSDTCSSTGHSPEALQALPWECSAIEEEQLCLGAQWDEMLWGSCLSTYAGWEQEHQLLTFPFLPPQDTMIEDCLWNL